VILLNNSENNGPNRGIDSMHDERVLNGPGSDNVDISEETIIPTFNKDPPDNNGRSSSFGVRRP